MSKPIIKWFGGKSRFAKKIVPIISQIPHEIFVDCFGGGGNIILSKSPSRCEIYNDIDSGLVNFFKILRDPKKSVEFQEKLRLTPFSREEFEYCRDNYNPDLEDDVEKARMWFTRIRQSFGGLGVCWAVSKTATNKGDLDVAAWISAIERIQDVTTRFRNIKIENKDWENMFDLYDTEKTLWYLDPPYVQDVRSNAQYENDFTNEQHMKLIKRLLEMKGMCILSGYANDIYKQLEQTGWGIIQFDAYSMAFANVGAQNETQGEKEPAKDDFKRVECLWVDPKTKKKLMI